MHSHAIRFQKALGKGQKIPPTDSSRKIEKRLEPSVLNTIMPTSAILKSIFPNPWYLVPNAMQNYGYWVGSPMLTDDLVESYR